MIYIYIYIYIYKQARAHVRTCQDIQIYPTTLPSKLEWVLNHALSKTKHVSASEKAYSKNKPRASVDAIIHEQVN